MQFNIAQCRSCIWARVNTVQHCRLSALGPEGSFTEEDLDVLVESRSQECALAAKQPTTGKSAAGTVRVAGYGK